MDEIFQRIADDLPTVQAHIERAEVLLRALREVGETNEALEERLRELKARKARWERMLAARGANVGAVPTD